MPLFVNTFSEGRVEQLFDLAALVEKIFSSAGLEYWIVGGLAAYLYVEESEPDAGRVTKDIDVVVRRDDLEKIAPSGRAGRPSIPPRGRSRHAGAGRKAACAEAVHLVFTGEKVRREYPEPGTGALSKNQRASADSARGPGSHETH